MDLLDIELQIKELCEVKTLTSWYQLFELDKLLAKETWDKNLAYADKAERLVVMSSNCCIDIAQNHLSNEEQAEITAFIQGKIDRSEM